MLTTCFSTENAFKKVMCVVCIYTNVNKIGQDFMLHI